MFQNISIFWVFTKKYLCYDFKPQLGSYQNSSQTSTNQLEKKIGGLSILTLF